MVFFNDELFVAVILSVLVKAITKFVIAYTNT